MKNLLEKYLSLYLLKIKQRIPKPEAKTLVGLDIGTATIKAVEISNSAETHEIEKFSIEPVNSNDVAGSIKKALEKASIVTKTVNTSISGQGVVIRYVQMPKMSVSDIKSSISLEADKYFPFPLEEVIMDCFVLEEEPLANKIFVLVAAAKKDLIEQRIALLSNLNLEVETILTDSIATANVFNVLNHKPDTKEALAEPAKPSAVALLNIGGAFSNFNIIKNNLPRFTRDIVIGGIDFSKRISHILGVDMESAEKLKIAPTEDQKGKILEACESILTNLIAEIRLSLDYFETESNVSAGMLYLSGGGSYLAGLAEIMKQNLGIEVRMWEPSLGLKINPNLSQTEFKEQVNKLGTAIGLALK